MKIDDRRPGDVARAVERLAGQGQRTFVLVSVDHGGMLDLERLGAARYAAGLQSTVVLEDDTVAVAAAR